MGLISNIGLHWQSLNVSQANLSHILHCLHSCYSIGKGVTALWAVSLSRTPLPLLPALPPGKKDYRPSWFWFPGEACYLQVRDTTVRRPASLPFGLFKEGTKQLKSILKALICRLLPTWGWGWAFHELIARQNKKGEVSCKAKNKSYTLATGLFLCVCACTCACMSRLH